MELFGVLIGGALVLVGQLLTHRFTLQRERRAELGDRIDRAILCFSEADTAMSRLIDSVDKGRLPAILEKEGAAVEEVQTEMRAAVFSLGLRSDRPLYGMFIAAEEQYHEVWKLVQPHALSQDPRALDRARGMMDEELREALSTCMHYSGSVLRLGPRKAYVRAMLPGGEPPDTSVPPGSI